MRSLTGYKKCLGRYLDQWFDADDKLKVETYSKECDDLLDDIDEIKKEFLWFVSEVYIIIGRVSTFGNKPEGYIKELNEPMEEYINNIVNVIIPKVNDLSDYIMPFEEDFTQAESNLKGLNTNLGIIKSTMDDMKKLMDKFSKTGKLSKLVPTKALIDNTTAKITAILGKITDWVLIPCNLITTESHLVCKCGGTISFYDNGQSYDEMSDRIVQASEDLFEFMKEKCNTWYNGWAELQTDPSDLASCTQKEKEIRNSKQAIEKVANFNGAISTNTNTEIKSIDDARSGIHLEYWSHAYFEEGKSLASGILTIFAIFLGPAGYPLSMGLLFYQYMEEGDGSRSPTLGEIMGFADIYSPFHSVDAIKNISGLFDASSAATSLFYTSNDTWTEEIRITFFTDDYAVIGSQKLREDGTKEGESKFELFDYFKYMESPKSNGIKWKLEEIEGEEYDTYMDAP